MADFEMAFQKLMKDEGVGLSHHPSDKGKQTFAGISRKFHPKWGGWQYIDVGDTPPTDLVRDFYRENFWQPLKGNSIDSQAVANAAFGQYVNMGTNGIKLLQHCLRVVADGKVGPKTLAALNAKDPVLLLLTYALANVKRYHEIGMKDKSQRVFWPGWIRRAIAIAEEA